MGTRAEDFGMMPLSVHDKGSCMNKMSIFSRLKIRNPKHEIRNKTKIQISNVKNVGDSSFLDIRALNLFRISDFVFRI